MTNYDCINCDAKNLSATSAHTHASKAHHCVPASGSTDCLSGYCGRNDH